MMKVIGLMTGTSADGIDAVLVDIPEDVREFRLLAYVHEPYSDEVRSRIFRLFSSKRGTVDQICQMNFLLGELLARAALEVVAAAGLSPEEVDLIGSHGQTIWHAVDEDSPVKSTLQIGEPGVIVERTGITTVADFRTRDVAAGGQGAPLVSYLDHLFFTHATLNRAVQNIGGIANVTVLPSRQSGGEPFAFDTGPGVMLIDYAASRATGGRWRYDQDGALAAKGQVRGDLLEELLAHPYLQKSPPKTTGREEFGAHFGVKVWARGQELALRAADIVATLTAFTAASIARAYRDFIPFPIDEVILGGGGSYNPILVRSLAQRLPSARLLHHEDFGIPGQAKEAIAFAALAYETIRGHPSNLPGCTGASHPVIQGKITPGRLAIGVRKQA
jgi:anhydro-N-acetylmuramic acid kinase